MAVNTTGNLRPLHSDPACGRGLLARGMSTPTAAIEPVALKDGTFMLGDEVLTDPAHAKHLSMLSGLVTADMEDIQNLIFAESDVRANV